MVAVAGLGKWNGVALLSRVGLAEVVKGLTGEPGFPQPEARAIGATCAGVRLWSVYVPHGREPDHPHYAYKLEWLGALREVVARDLADDRALAVCGDFNVAPTDANVWDPTEFAHATHVTPPERQALAALRALGLADVVPRPLKYDHPFTYWDYRAGMFHKNLGTHRPRLSQPTLRHRGARRLRGLGGTKGQGSFGSRSRRRRRRRRRRCGRPRSAGRGGLGG